MPKLGDSCDSQSNDEFAEFYFSPPDGAGILDSSVSSTIDYDF